ncbi:hypothetical protein, partial [Rhizobium alvei]
LKPKATADTRRPRLSFFLSYNLKELTINRPQTQHPCQTRPKQSTISGNHFSICSPVNQAETQSPERAPQPLEATAAPFDVAAYKTGSFCCQQHNYRNRKKNDMLLKLKRYFDDIFTNARFGGFCTG